MRDTLVKYFCDNQKENYQKYFRHCIPPSIRLGLAKTINYYIIVYKKARFPWLFSRFKSNTCFSCILYHISKKVQVFKNILITYILQILFPHNSLIFHYYSILSPQLIPVLHGNSRIRLDKYDAFFPVYPQNQNL